MSKFIKKDAFYVGELSFEDFIKIHQKLENIGEKMYFSTKERKLEGNFDYLTLFFDGTSWAGGTYKTKKTSFSELSKIYTFQDINLFLNNELTYEIY